MPELLDSQGFVDKLLGHLQVERRDSQGLLAFYQEYNKRLEDIQNDKSSKKLKIGILGKKIKQLDSFESTYRNLEMFCQ